MGTSKKEANGTNGSHGTNGANGETKPRRARMRRVCLVCCGPGCLYFGLLGFSPAMFEMYLQMNTDWQHTMPMDAPVDITDMEEVFGIHSFEETLPYTSWNLDRPLIFRNFTDCAHTFETDILPRRAKQVDEYRKVNYLPEDLPGNVYTRGIAPGEPIMKSLEDTVADQSPNEYASFLRIFDSTDYKMLMNTTWDHAKKFKMDSSFISHFSWPLISSNIHAAPMVYTYSLQCHGIKSWLFWSHKTLNKYGHNTIVHPAGGVISGTPQSILRIPTIRANVGPGDLLFFPPLWYHAVVTSAGKNIMFAMRRADGKTFLSSFLISPRDSTLWLLRTIYDQPNILEKLAGMMFGRFARERKEKQDEEHKLGFSSVRVKPFQEKFASNVARTFPDEHRLFNGLSYFGLPAEGYKKPGTTPKKVISFGDFWDVVYQDNKWEWLKEMIENRKTGKA